MCHKITVHGLNVLSVGSAPQTESATQGVTINRRHHARRGQHHHLWPSAVTERRLQSGRARHRQTGPQGGDQQARPANLGVSAGLHAPRLRGRHDKRGQLGQPAARGRSGRPLPCRRYHPGAGPTGGASSAHRCGRKLPTTRLQVGKPRDVNTRQGRQLQNCELRLTDPSCNSFGLQLWDAELIRLAQQWTPWETVLLVTDCRIKYDAYRQTAVAVAGSQTVVTPEPRLRAAQALAQFGRRCRAERSAAELNSAGDEDINLSSVRDSCSILELEKRLQQLEDVTASHVVIVPAFVTWLPLESDRYKITRCGRCSRYVPETEGQCRNPDCVAGAGGQLQQVFSLRVGIADHQAGMEKLLLEGRHAETALGTTLSRFEAMTETERLDLKHSWLMEHARIWIKYQMRADGRPLLKILQMERTCTDQ